MVTFEVFRRAEQRQYWILGLAVVAFMFAMPAPTAQAKEAGWPTVSPPGGQVSVAMPIPPTHRDMSTDQTPLGPVEHHIYQNRVRTSTEAGVYTFAYTRLKNGRPKQALSAGQWLAHVESQQTKQWAARARAELIQSSDIKVQGHKGRELLFKLPDATMKLRLVVAGDQLVVLGGITPGPTRTHKHIERFFNSLKFKR